MLMAMAVMQLVVMLLFDVIQDGEERLEVHAG
jgi:hypothetical protein